MNQKEVRIRIKVKWNLFPLPSKQQMSKSLSSASINLLYLSSLFFFFSQSYWVGGSKNIFSLLSRPPRHLIFSSLFSSCLVCGCRVSDLFPSLSILSLSVRLRHLPVHRSQEASAAGAARKDKKRESDWRESLQLPNSPPPFSSRRCLLALLPVFVRGKDDDAWW